MLKFFKNLLFPKKKQVETEPEVIIDFENGNMKIISDRQLSEEEIIEIAKREMLKHSCELIESEEDDD